MAFPNLALRSGGVNHATNTGVPVNGANTFLHNIPNVDDATWIDVDVIALGPSITAATLTSVNTTTIVINFTQSGTDQATVNATLQHTIDR